MLLFDVGNTRIKWGWWEDGRIGATDAAVHRESQWTLPSAAAGWRPRRAAAVSVAGPAVNAQLAAEVQRRWGLELEFLWPTAAAAGVRNGYTEPGRLGADRWAAVVAAHRRAGAACVIDCGSAVTVDAVTAGGEHVGGIIIPGLAMMRRALVQDTHRLPAVEHGPVELFARDTVTAVRSGTLVGLAAMLEGLAARVRARLGAELPLYLTGGDASELASQLRVPVQVAPDLVLEGVALLAEETS